MTPALAVFDLGKTNAKLALFSPVGETIAERRMQPRPMIADGLMVLDTGAVEAWLRQSLDDLAGAFDLTGLMISTHGCAFAIIGNGRLAAPILDYEQPMPPAADAAFAKVAPPFAETFSPELPAGLNPARHLFLREWLTPGIVSRADHILSYPQYWVWRLTGTLASEVSFLGCHSHLWAPLRGDFSSLVDRLGWRAKFPPLRPAGDVMGSMKAGGRDLPVHNGVHDSNAAFHFYRSLGFSRFTLVSTGTWVIVFNPDCPLSVLDPARDMLANVTVKGEPVATARFMGGREYELISGGARGGVAADALADAVRSGAMALPSFAPGGPFRGTEGRLAGPPPATTSERAAIATLYIALMTDLTLDRLGSSGDIILDGGLAQNARLLGLIAALRPGQALRATTNPEGTAMGAAALAFAAAGQGGGFPVRLDRVPAAAPPGLGAYRAIWRERAGAFRKP
ncbi:MAG: FGGY-family carbohydrate kinase [Paracoccaceae bacterium]